MYRYILHGPTECDNPLHSGLDYCWNNCKIDLAKGKETEQVFEFDKDYVLGILGSQNKHPIVQGFVALLSQANFTVLHFPKENMLKSKFRNY